MLTPEVLACLSELCALLMEEQIWDSGTEVEPTCSQQAGDPCLKFYRDVQCDQITHVCIFGVMRRISNPRQCAEFSRESGAQQFVDGGAVSSTPGLSVLTPNPSPWRVGATESILLGSTPVACSPRQKVVCCVDIRQGLIDVIGKTGDERLTAGWQYLFYIGGQPVGGETGYDVTTTLAGDEVRYAPQTIRRCFEVPLALQGMPLVVTQTPWAVTNNGDTFSGDSIVYRGSELNAECKVTEDC